MPWSVQYDPETQIVEVVYSGNVTGAELSAAVTARVQLQSEHESLYVLLNCKQVEWMVDGVMSVHTLPGETYISTHVNSRTRHALLLSDNLPAREASWHYELACKNRGWRAKTFEDRREAIDWLLEMSAAPSPDECDALPCPSSAQQREPDSLNS